MEIVNFFECDRQVELIEKIADCDWRAAKFLVELLQTNKFYEMLGGWGYLFILMDGDQLVSFVTLTGQDAIRDETMTPWIGFVFTAPEYRGHRWAGRLLVHSEECARKLGYSKIYIATDHVGLYEKYGFVYMDNRLDLWGGENRVYYKNT